MAPVAHRSLAFRNGPQATGPLSQLHTCMGPVGIQAAAIASSAPLKGADIGTSAPLSSLPAGPKAFGSSCSSQWSRPGGESATLSRTGWGGAAPTH